MINACDADACFLLAIEQQQVTARYGITELLGQHRHLISRDRGLHLSLKPWIAAQMLKKRLHR